MKRSLHLFPSKPLTCREVVRPLRIQEETGEEVHDLFTSENLTSRRDRSTSSHQKADIARDRLTSSLQERDISRGPGPLRIKKSHIRRGPTKLQPPAISPLIGDLSEGEQIVTAKCVVFALQVRIIQKPDAMARVMAPPVAGVEPCSSSFRRRDRVAHPRPHALLPCSRLGGLARSPGNR